MANARPVVLVVEDHRETRVLLQELLESEGYAVESAADAAAGLARIEAGEVDLMLLDLFLPDVDGLELCRQVRAGEAKSHVPIIMVTAAEANAQEQASLAAGADDYLSKPFDIDELFDRVRTCLDRRLALA
jgi:DNA-binding response OmpR family regulator